MVNLVLEYAGRDATKLHRDLGAFDVLVLDRYFNGPSNPHKETREREASLFKNSCLLAAFQNFGIEDDDGRFGIDHESTSLHVDLVGGEPQSILGAHDVDHPRTELLWIVRGVLEIEFWHGLRQNFGYRKVSSFAERLHVVALELKFSRKTSDR